MKTMKKEMSIFTALFICAVLTFSTASVRADAVSISEAWMDWASLTITGDITWSNTGSQSYADAGDDTGSTSSSEDSQRIRGEWVDTDAFASIGDSYGNAYTSDYDLYEEVYAIPNEATTMRAYADAEAYRWGNFTADSNGWVEFSADYELWQELLTDYAGQSAYGYAEAGLYLWNSNTSGWDYDPSVLDNTVWDGESITDSNDGTLTVAMWFDAGHSGYFQAWAYNEADVHIPEPATIALLGLGALSLLRRKRIKTKKLILTTGLFVLMVSVLPASALPVTIYSVSGPQDGMSVSVRGGADEVGDGFPPDELIETLHPGWDASYYTPCTEGYDDPLKPNWMVLIKNTSNRTFFDLWYVGDTHFSPTGGGLVYDTTLSNFDGYIGNAGLNDAGYAFKIDHVGVNQPLYLESMTWDNLFEPGETWWFVIQDYFNIYGGTAVPFNSVGIASLSGGYPPSTGSLITEPDGVPEPTTIALLGLGALSLLRRRKNS